MKKTIKKTLISVLAAATIFTSTTPSLAKAITVNMPYSIHETKESTNISSGVVHEKIMRFTTAGWWNINVLRINLTDPYTDIQGLISQKGITGRDKVSSMVAKSDAIAGINGDYFNYSPLPSSMGTLINNGEVISSPIERAYALPTLFIDVLNQSKIEYFDRNITVTNGRTETQVFVNTINKATKDFDTMTLLNKHWGAKSIGTRFHKDLIEVVVENDVVTDVRIGKEAVPIPQNGYVLAVRGDKNYGIHKFQVGDPMKLHVATNPGLENIKFAIGGGSIILKDGQLSLTNINSKGNEPRTGMGISKDGTELILVTIDGRDSSFKGVSQEMFGALLRELGAYNALNLDGGGSTTMAVKSVDDKKVSVVNKPSDGGERAVVNAVGVFSTAPAGQLSYLKVETDDPNMFIDTTRRFTVKGYDEYHNPVPLENSNLVFTQEGALGTITGNSFKASSKGKATVTANYNGVTGSTTVNVLGVVADLTSTLNNFNIDINSEKVLPVFSGKDEKGYEAKIYPEDINFSTTNPIGTVTNGTFTSGEESLAGALTAKLGNGVENILVSVGSKGTLVEGFENMNNLKFESFPTTVTGGISLNPNAKEGVKSVALKYDFSNGENTRAAYLNFIKGDKLGLTLPSTPRKLGLWVHGDTSGSWLRGNIKDNKGNSHTIDFAKSIEWDGWQHLTVDLPSNISYPIVLERIYVVETDSLKKQSGEILIDGLSAFYPPSVGNIVLPTPSTLIDNKNVFNKVEGETGYSFSVTMEPKGLNEMVKYDASTKIKSRINKHKMAIFLGGASDEFQKGLTNYSKINANSLYSKNRHYDMTFINVNTSKNGIRSSDASQWNKLKADLNSIETNNVALFLSTPLFGSGGFTDLLEADLLHKYLVELDEKDKNVYVVHGGSSNTSDLKDGIRYIGLNTKPISAPEDIYNLSIVEFVVNGPNVTYQISPLFEKPKVKVN